MTIFDPVADLLTRIRNAKEARHRYVDFAPSKMKIEIVRVLQERGFIDKFLVDEKQRRARLFLKYAEGRDSVIKGLKRISCPSIRKYIGYKKIPRIHGGMGIAIISTPSGVLDGETARQMKVGGELLCLVW